MDLRRHVVSAAIGRLHYARPAAGNDHIIAGVVFLTDGRNQPGELPGGFVIMAALGDFFGPGDRPLAPRIVGRVGQAGFGRAPIAPGQRPARQSACCQTTRSWSGYCSAENTIPA